MPGAPRWPFERARKLRILWRNGTRSGEIAAALGVTRCAALGKLRRLGLLGNCPQPEKIRRMSAARLDYLERTRSTSSMRVSA